MAKSYTGENIFVLTMFYLMAGTMTLVFMHIFEASMLDPENFTGRDVVVILLWPLFIIKYLLLGIWYVISTGAVMLF